VVTGVAVVQTKESPREFLRAARRNLTEVEAASPAGIRWLTHDVERLDQECGALRGELSELRTRHEVLQNEHMDKRVEIESLKAKSRDSLKTEILSIICMSAGSVGLGAAPKYLDIPEAAQFAVIVLAVSVVLIIGGIVLRVWK
jgi:hypothetical protein